MENINITFTGIIDYIRDKDSQIEFLQKQNNRYLSRYNKLIENKNKAIEYIMTNLISEWDIKNGGNVSGSDLPVDAITPILEILQENES